MLNYKCWKWIYHTWQKFLAKEVGNMARDCLQEGRQWVHKELK